MTTTTTTATLIFGTRVRAITRPGIAPAEVTEFHAHDGYEDVTTAIEPSTTRLACPGSAPPGSLSSSPTETSTRPGPSPGRPAPTGCWPPAAPCCGWRPAAGPAVPRSYRPPPGRPRHHHRGGRPRRHPARHHLTGPPPGSPHRPGRPGTDTAPVTATPNGDRSTMPGLGDGAGVGGAFGGEGAFHLGRTARAAGRRCGPYLHRRCCSAAGRPGSARRCRAREVVREVEHLSQVTAEPVPGRVGGRYRLPCRAGATDGPGAGRLAAVRRPRRARPDARTAPPGSAGSAWSWVRSATSSAAGCRPSVGWASSSPPVRRCGGSVVMMQTTVRMRVPPAPS